MAEKVKDEVQVLKERLSECQKMYNELLKNSKNDLDSQEEKYQKMVEKKNDIILERVLRIEELERQVSQLKQV